jgi:hypothetical protein
MTSAGIRDFKEAVPVSRLETRPLAHNHGCEPILQKDMVEARKKQYIG